MERKNAYILSMCCLCIGILLGYAIYKGEEYYQRKQENITSTEKFYTYLFGDDNQTEEYCKKKSLHKGETYTMTEVIMRTYVCKCIPSKLRELLSNDEAKENYEQIMTTDNKEANAQTKELFVEMAGFVCRDEIERFGLEEAERKYGKLDINIQNKKNTE